MNQTLLSISNYEQDLNLMDTVYNNENGRINILILLVVIQKLFWNSWYFVLFLLCITVNLPGNTWVSGKEISEGVWNWDSNGLPFYHTRWFVGQPDDLTSLNCVYLASSALFYWRDANCSAPMYFICEG